MREVCSTEEFCPKDSMVIHSGDGPHEGHAETFERARKMVKTGKVVFVIPQNKEKSNGMFSLEERREMMKLLLPDAKILLAPEEQDVLDFLFRAKNIFRGIRSAVDIFETRSTFNAYLSGIGIKKQDEIMKKLRFIQRSEELLNVSSMSLKNLVRAGRIDEARQHTHENVVGRILAKVNEVK